VNTTLTSTVRLALRRVRLRKVRRTVRRRLFEHTVARGLQLVDAPVERLGYAEGRWRVPPDTIDAGWVCYCVGTGKNISFDLALIERYGCEVHAFEPAPEAASYVAEAAHGVARYRFHPVALAPVDGPLRMHRAEDPSHISLSAANVQLTRETVTVPGRSLTSLMDELGHSHVDLLKADLEGLEYDVLSPGLLERVGVRVLCFDVHPTVSGVRALGFLDELRSAGFVPVSSDGMKLTLLRADDVRRVRRG
jgi:FkbM family methyltransferase